MLTTTPIKLKTETKMKPDKNTIPQQFIEKLRAEKPNIRVPRSNILSTNVTRLVLEDIQKEFNLEDNHCALAVLTIFFHQGATARSCDSNMTITIFNQSIRLSTIRKIFKQHNIAKGERKFARTYATYIHTIAQELELPGNLYSKIKRLNPEKTFTNTERCWLSDFQAYNEDAPTHLRDLIIQSFNFKQQTKQKKNPSGK